MKLLCELLVRTHARTRAGTQHSDRSPGRGRACVAMLHACDARTTSGPLVTELKHATALTKALVCYTV
jgi:hypothetical protein